MGRNNILLLGIESDKNRPILATEEQDQISESLDNSDRYNLEARSKVSSDKISSLFNKYDPCIFHFNGHGTTKGIALNGSGDITNLFLSSQLEALIKAHQSTIKCVILGSCHTKDVGNKIAKHVPYVIAMQGEIGNEAAISFSKAFYEALAKGLDFEESYHKGKMQIKIEGLTDFENTPLLFINHALLEKKYGLEISKDIEIKEHDLDYSISSDNSYSVIEIIDQLKKLVNLSNLVKPIKILFISNNIFNDDNGNNRLKKWAEEERQDPNKTIIVKLDNFKQSLPEGLQDVPIFSFLKDENKLKNLFHNTLRELSFAIEQLSTQGNIKYKGAIYLARSSRSLNNYRERIKRFLRDNGYQVLPFNNDLLKLSEDIIFKIKSDMKECKYFIQLLDQDPINNAAVEQYKIAEELGITKSLWRSNNLIIEDDLSDDYKQLLNSAISTTYNNFENELGILLKEMDDEYKDIDAHDKFVYINTSPLDKDLAQKVAKYLSEKNNTFGILLNRFGENDPPSVLQEQQEKKMKRCHYMIIVQCETPGESIDELIDFADDLFYVKQIRDKPIETWVCQSEKAEVLSIHLPKMEFIKCKDKYDKDCVKNFIKMLNGKNHG